jgi:hypothetical protein
MSWLHSYIHAYMHTCSWVRVLGMCTGVLAPLHVCNIAEVRYGDLETFGGRYSWVDEGGQT